MTASFSLPRLCWGRWPAGPDGVWKAAQRWTRVGAARRATLGAVRTAGKRHGRAAALPSIVTEVRPGAASEHDASGNDALARFAQPSARRSWVPQTNADRTLFCGFRLPCGQNHRRSGRPHARNGRSEDSGRRTRRMVATGGISRPSLSRRAHHRWASDRHRAHPRGAPGLKREAPQSLLNTPDCISVLGRSFEPRPAPHPALRATFPSRAGEGEPRR